MQNRGKSSKKSLAGLESNRSDKDVLEQRRAKLRRLLQQRAAEGVTESELSYGQKGLWFFRELAPECAAYNVSLACRVKWDVDLSALQASFQTLTDRHAALRTTFGSRDGKPVQRVHSRQDVAFHQIDARGWSETELHQQASTEAYRPFDLEHGPLFRCTVFESGEDSILLFSIHHIIGDYWSLVLLMSELQVIYPAIRRGEPIETAPPTDRFVDYVSWQRSMLESAQGEALWEYWKNRLDGDLPALDLPTDAPRPRLQTYRGAAVSFQVGPELTERLKQVSAAADLTFNMLLLAAYQVLLHRYTGQNDILVGSPCMGRSRAEFESIVGFFTNIVVFRGELESSQSFDNFLQQTKRTVLSGLDHQDFPFALLVERLLPDRDLSRPPLYQAGFAFQKSQKEEVLGAASLMMGSETTRLLLDGAELEPYPLEPVATPFEIDLTLEESAGCLTGYLQYNADLFADSTIEQLAAHYQTLLASIASDSSRAIGRLPILSDDERQQALIARNDTRAPFPDDLCAHELFEEQVMKTPDAIAIIWKGEELRYAELNRRANQLAHYLRAQGIGPGDLVGVLLDRRPELIIAVMGILKAGAAYVPMDVSNPLDRLERIAASANLAATVTLSSFASRMGGRGGNLVSLDHLDAELSGCSAENPDRRADPSSQIYVIYTSGSTGHPKGAGVYHRSFVNLLYWLRTDFDMGSDDRELVITSHSFDLTQKSLYQMLISGGQVVLSECEPYEWDGIEQEMTRHQITLLNCAPSHIYPLSRASTHACLKELRLLFVGGESLDVSRLEAWIRSQSFKTTIVHIYGPTECTDISLFNRIDDPLPYLNRRVPLGRPIPNVEVYVVDGQFEPVPTGVVGEVCVSGISVGSGYVGDPKQTAERFLDNPFPSSWGRPLYRTGDLGRALPNGQIEFVGRCDDQIKIRGFRVELGEIENVLRQHEAVADSVVVAREHGPGDHRLVAYVVPNLEDASTSSEVMRWSGERVQEWQSVHDQTYANAKSIEDPTFNIAGWESSYTGQPLSVEEMRQWRDSFVNQVLGRRPKNVLEIGVGSGMLLFEIAPHCDRYVATDFSPSVLSQLEQTLQRESELRDRIELRQQSADDFSGIPKETFDAVILNSVVQYFPGVDYLLEVLDGVLDHVRPGGFVMLGDIRHLQLLAAFQASVQLFRAEGELPVDQLRERIHTHLNCEQELLLDPAFFHALAVRYPPIRNVHICLKQGAYRNEMNKFRYDVLLELEDHKNGPLLSGSWQAWEQQRYSLSQWKELLQRTTPPQIGIRGVPNSRVLRDVVANRLLNNHEAKYDNCRTLEKELETLVANSQAGEGMEPDDWRKIADELGYQVECTWSGSSASDPSGEGRYDVLLWRDSGDQRQSGMISHPPLRRHARPWSTYANDPLRGKYLSSMGPRLREYLTRKLPDYMVPTALVMLDRLPLNANGKVDRKALPAPESGRPELAEPYVAPRTEPEQAMVRIWEEVLGIEEVGIHDNFFELGGHSLLATQVMSRANDYFKKRVALRALFERPTVSQLTLRFEQETEESDGRTPIVRVGREQGVALSYAQERIWFLSKVHPDSPAYNMSAALCLDGELEINALTSSVNVIVERHEVLRTAILSSGGRPVARILEQVDVEIPIEDLSALSATEQSDEVRRLATEEAHLPFDLSQAPLLRIKLLRQSAKRHILLFTIHHAVADGWSIGVLMRELAVLYEGYSLQRESGLASLPFQYADYAAWQRRESADANLECHHEYWQQQLQGMPQSLALPLDHPRPPVQSLRGAHCRFDLPKALIDQLRNLGQAHGATLFMTLLAVFETLLYRYSGQTQFGVGTLVAGRSQRQLEDLIGCFVNTIVLRADLSGAPPFNELLTRVRDVVLESQPHQELPFEELVDRLQISRDLSRSPLFQVLFTLDNSPHPDLRLSGIELSEVDVVNRTAKFDLAVLMRESEEGLIGDLEFDNDLFDVETIQQILIHYRTLLESVVRQPDESIGRLTLLTEDEQQRELIEWNQTDHAFPDDQCVHEMFEEQAALTPDDIAVVWKDVSWTYAELNRQANRIAGYLQKQGVGPNVLVGVLLPRQPELVAAVFGVLKAGGAYVPMDVRNPKERLEQIVRNARLHTVVTLDSYRSYLSTADTDVVCLDDLADELAEQSDGNPVSTVQPTDLIYVIYTSGSTGVPKGAGVYHRSFVNLLHWLRTDFDMGSDGRELMITSHSFDLTQKTFYQTLVSGGRLYLSGSESYDFDAIAKEMAAADITLLNCTPSNISALTVPCRVDALDQLRLLFVGGEPLNVQKLANWFEQESYDAEIVHIYGPTECTDIALFERVRDPSQYVACRIPLGRPINNVQAFVLSEAMELVPPGVLGEICISGASLGAGYQGDPELTRSKFVPHPFADDANEKMYRTGDLGRYLRDGRIEFVGRIDHQVKIHGYRVELGEVEAALRQYPTVEDAVVTVHETEEGQQRLLAYVVAEETSEPTGMTLEELRQHLRRKLPPWMIPAALVTLDAFPLTSAGKIDRGALPIPDAWERQVETPYVEPATEVERVLAQVWAEVMGLEKVGINDNFFELGGGSLTTMQVIDRAQELGLEVNVESVETEDYQEEMLGPQLIFSYPTVAELAPLLELTGTEKSGDVLR